MTEEFKLNDGFHQEQGGQYLHNPFHIFIVCLFGIIDAVLIVKQDQNDQIGDPNDPTKQCIEHGEVRYSKRTQNKKKCGCNCIYIYPITY